MRKHKSLFRLPNKKLRLDCFYSNLSKCETRVNEAQLTNTTLVHKHEQQTLTAVLVVNTRSQNRLTITKFELVPVTRFVVNKVVIVVETRNSLSKKAS